MKTDPCFRSVRIHQLLVLCMIALGISDNRASAGVAALPSVDSSISSKKTVPHLRLEVNVVEYPEDKGMEVFRVMGLADSPAGLTIDTPRVPHTGTLPEKPASIVTSLSKPDTSLTWILTKSLNEFILDKLKQSDDAQVITGPRVVASEGQLTKLEFEYPGGIVTQLDPRPNSSGLTEVLDAFPTLYVEPRIKGDGSIDLKTTQAIRDLVGYHLGGGSEDVWDYVESSGANPAPTGTSFTMPLAVSKPKPLYRLREVSGNAAVRSGQTLVVSGLTASTTSRTNISDSTRVPLLGDLPIAGRLFRARTIPREQKKLLVFITPTLLDEDGKPVQQKDAQENTAPASGSEK